MDRTNFLRRVPPLLEQDKPFYNRALSFLQHVFALFQMAKQTKEYKLAQMLKYQEETGNTKVRTWLGDDAAYTSWVGECLVTLQLLRPFSSSFLYLRAACRALTDTSCHAGGD